MAFAPSSPLPLRGVVARRLQVSHRDVVRVSRTRSTTILSMRAGRRAPDFDSGWLPESDSSYEEVRVLSLGPAEPCRSGGSLLTLMPVSGGRDAFRMSVTCGQAESVRAALRGARNPGRFAGRPGTHDLFKRVLDAQSAFVTKAAITHMRADVFIARVWVRSPLVGEVHLDARPSDAIAMALRSGAPLFLNTALLEEWSVPVDAVRRDAAHGLCECPEVSDTCKSATTLLAEVRAAPEHVALAKLKMALDLAVRLQRFREAARLRDQIARICPADRLEEMLQEAIREERYADAAALQDQIVLWRARLRRWEKGGAESSVYGDNIDAIINITKSELESDGERKEPDNPGNSTNGGSATDDLTDS